MMTTIFLTLAAVLGVVPATVALNLVAQAATPSPQEPINAVGCE
jgi:hypothetical protein